MRTTAGSLLVAIVAIAVMGTGSPANEEQLFKRLWDEGLDKMSEEKLDEAIVIFEAQSEMAPTHPGPLYNMACAYGRKGDHASALSWLEHSVERGWDSSEQTRADNDLALLRGCEQLERLLKIMDVNYKAWVERSWTAHREIQREQAQSFASLEKLEGHFDDMRESLEEERYRHGDHEYQVLEWRFLDEKVAALELYISGHNEATEREQAGLALVEAIAAYKEPILFGYWDGDGPLVVESAERFLAEFPNSEHAPDVSYLRALAIWLSRPRPEGDGYEESNHFPVEHVVAFDGNLSELIQQFPTSLIAGKALIKRMELAELGYAGNISPFQQECHSTLIGDFGNRPEIMDLAWRNIRRTMFHAQGLDGFEGTDLQGKNWNHVTMTGKVVLIDFWATWCGPCVSELPTLKRTYADFKDQGFEIVGVSLDRGQRETFEEKTSKLEITWPQIFDGNGWKTGLAQQFHVHSIPCTILLDRNGRVAGIDYRGEELFRRIGELVGE